MRVNRTAPLLVTALAIAALAPTFLVSATGVTTTHVTGEATGFLPSPCSCEASVTIAANAQGDGTALEGSGTSHATTGVTNHYTLTGTLDGSTLSLSGMIVKSTSPALVGSPIAIEADVDTGELVFTLGPLAGGVFAGQTLVFTGSANVVVTGP